MHSSRIGVMRSVAVVGFYTALSRVLGFVREILMAVLFGTTLAKSAFDIAFRIPNLFRRLFGEGALSAAFVPVFSDTLEHDGMEGANRLSGKVIVLLGLVLFSIVSIGVIVISGVLAFSDPSGMLAQVLSLLRIMLPYMFFICLVALCMAILNTFKHFAVPAFTPVLLNIIWISVLVFICPRFGDTPSKQIYGIAWGILLAGVLQLAIQAPALMKVGIRPEFSFSGYDSRIRKILILMGPVAIGMGVLQLNVLMDSVLAAFVAPWAPATLTYAERLIYLPLGVFATALGTVLLPTFSRSSSQGRLDEIRETMGFALKNLFLIMVPAAIGLIVLSFPVVELAYRWGDGKFDRESTILTARVLSFYAPGLIAFGSFKVIAPAFYSMKDTITPIKVGIPVVALNLLLNVTFIMTWPSGYRHAGLALATVIASATNCLILGFVFHCRVGSPGWKSVAACGLKALFAALFMGIAVFFIHLFLAETFATLAWPAKAQQFVAVFGSIVCGAVIYIVLVNILCPKDLRHIKALFKSDRSDV